MVARAIGEIGRDAKVLPRLDDGVAGAWANRVNSTIC
jgi:hypothetical protein